MHDVSLFSGMRDASYPEYHVFAPLYLSSAIPGAARHSSLDEYVICHVSSLIFSIFDVWLPVKTDTTNKEALLNISRRFSIAM